MCAKSEVMDLFKRYSDLVALGAAGALILYMMVKVFAVFSANNTGTASPEVMSTSFAISSVKSAPKQASDFTGLNYRDFTSTIEIPVTREAIWLKVKVKEQASTAQSFYLNTENYIAKYANAFIVNEDGFEQIFTQEKPSGVFSQPQGISIPLNLREQTEQTIYLQVVSPHSSHFHFNVQTEEDYLNSHYRFLNSTVAICSVLLLLCFINLLFFKVLKAFYHYLYVFQQLLIVVLVLHTVGAIFLTAVQFSFLSQFALIVGLLFATQFLSVKQLYPRVATGIYWLSILLFGFALLQLVFPSLYWLFIKIRPLQFALVMAIPSILAYKKMRQGYLYAASMFFGGVLFAGLLQVFLLSVHNIIEVEWLAHYDFLYLAIFIEGLTLFIAIGQKLSLSQQRKQHYLESLNQVYSEQLENTQQLQRQANLLSQLNTEQLQAQQATAGLNHDIHHHLFLLKLSCDHLHAQKADPQYIQAMSNSIAYLESLSDDMLNVNVSKLQEAKIESLDVYDLIQSLFVTFKGKAELKGLQLKRHCRKSLQISTSHILLRRILENLLNNAIHYTHTGKVLITGRKKQCHIEIAVYDTGMGMAVNQRDNLCKLLQRGDVDSEGYGLGLYIVAQLCKQAGYTLSIETKKGVGSVFKITIPIFHS